VLVYRDASRTSTRAELRRELGTRLARCCHRPEALTREERGPLLSLLLVAAEIETALEDRAADEASSVGDLAAAMRGSESAPHRDVPATSAEASAKDVMRGLTDACAEAWWTGRFWDRERWERELGALSLPDGLVLKRPEGFAYYALDPAAYARAAAAAAPSAGPVLIIGIRSIGAALSAVARAGLRARGLAAERFTVRPRGPVWDRAYTAADGELARLRALAPSECFIVDEGPGLSGSTFLAVGEGIERAGVPLERITFFTSHAVDARRLVTRDAVRRWGRFRVRVVDDATPYDGALDLGAGRWRHHVYRSEAEWPGCWTNSERRKFRVPSSLDLWKFVGLGHYGDAPLARAEQLAQAGFAPHVERAAPGYVRQRWVEGVPLRRPLAKQAARRGLVPQLVDYLAFRSAAFPAAPASVEPLECLARVNVAEALGVDLPASFRLELARPVYPDARLAPHEWIASPGGALIKIDAIDHGDDHFFPGPCDSAWDLAGVIVELELCEAESAALLAAYRQRTSDHAAARLPAYRIAYAAARVGFLNMAAACADREERERLARDERWYAERLRHFLSGMRRQ
jgi:hypothetical protein